MNYRTSFKFLLLVVGTCGLMWLTAARGRAAPAAVITVTNADASRDLAQAQSVGLNTELSVVGPHVSVQFGESVRMISIPTWPGTLDALLSAVPEHFKVQFAESMRMIAMPPLAGALNTLLTSVGAHIDLTAAEANRTLSLVYPTAFINDTVPPVVSQIKASSFANGNNATISWTTDEFANSAVEYGVQAGNYTQVVTDSLYVKNHAVSLSSLVIGNTYYYRVRSVDLSGNQTDSPEQSFVAKSNDVYLPLVRK